MRRHDLLILCVYGLLTGCSTLPIVNVKDVTTEVNYTPRYAAYRISENLRRAEKAFEQVKARHRGSSDVLERHLILEEAVAGTPLSPGNSARLLHDGPETYSAMVEDIKRARDYIFLESYIIEADSVGQFFSALLSRKAREGVKVHVIYDSVGSMNTPREFFQQLQDTGVHVLEFNPVNPMAVRTAGWNINYRDHRKILIVDGHIGYVGGINISSVYASASTPRIGKQQPSDVGWRDTNVRIQGPAVTGLETLFRSTWAAQKGPPITVKRNEPSALTAGPHLVRVVANSPEQPAIFVTFLSAIAHAEQSIDVTMAYFVPDAQTLQALEQAARRGVRVRLVLPSHSDFWAVLHAGRSYYTRLLRAGVEIYERQGALLHAKTATVDGVWSTVGSSNIDLRSFLHNDEVNVVILGQAFAAQMARMFKADLAHSVRIELEQWRKRPLRAKMAEWAARVWEYWL